MSSMRLVSLASAVTFALASQVWAAGPPVEFAVKKAHLRGASHGTLIFGDSNVEYKTSDSKDASRVSYDNIKQLQIPSPTRIVIRTYEDQGWVGAFADRTAVFEVEKGVVTPDAAANLLAKISRPVLLAVLPPFPGDLRYGVPVKHLRGWGGSQGELLLFDNALVYRSSEKNESRYWRFGDLASVFTPDKFRLELTAYEGGGGATRQYAFQLKSDLPPGFFDALWAAVNPPAAWKGVITRELGR